MKLGTTGWKNSLLLLGSVVKPHGIKGELKVRPCTGKPENFCRYHRLYLSTEDSQNYIECNDIQARVNGNSVILKLKECADRNRAEQLVGSQLWLESSDLPPAGPGEFYLHTLMGKRARTTDGQALGIIGEVMSSAQDVFVIRDGVQEHLIPAVGKFIVSVDEYEAIFDLPPGLLDINR